MPTRATATGVKALLKQRQTPDTMSAALSYRNAVVEFDSALLGYIEGGGLMIPRHQGGDAAAPQRLRGLRTKFRATARSFEPRRSDAAR